MMAALTLLVIITILANLAVELWGASQDVYALSGLGLLGVAVAIAVAITRYRLYDIDRLISRTVTYALVVGVLAAVYAAGIFLLRSLLPLQGDLAVAASTLAVAAFFNPLRRQVQYRVDRRFNRARYDAQQEVDRFAGRLRNDLDLDGLMADWVGVVTRTMQPEGASVWIRESH